MISLLVLRRNVNITKVTDIPQKQLRLLMKYMKNTDSSKNTAEKQTGKTKTPNLLICSLLR